MFIYLLKRILNRPVGYYTYIWQEVFLIRETSKAMLIIFDGRKAWVPKVWIARLKRNGGRSIKIKISEYHWSKKFV